MRAWALEVLPPWHVTYCRDDKGAVACARLWCNACVKHVDLPVAEDRVNRQLENQHCCGPLSTPWSRDR